MFRPSNDPDLQCHASHSSGLFISLFAMLLAFYGACIADNSTARFLSVVIFAPGFFIALWMSIVICNRWQQKIQQCLELTSQNNTLRQNLLSATPGPN